VKGIGGAIQTRHHPEGLLSDAAVVACVGQD
jgi:hypothetical protein